MKKLSIKLRVTIWYTITMIAVCTVVLFAMNSVGEGIVRRDMEGRIVQTVMEKSKFIVDPLGRARRIHSFEMYERGVAMILYDDEKNVIAGEVPFGIELAGDFENKSIREMIYNGNKYLEYDREIRHPNMEESFWLKGILPIDEGIFAVKSAIKNNVILTLVMILIASIGGYFIVSRAFVPVEKIRRTAKEISDSKDFSRRIQLGNGKDEIYALADTFDEMLDTIEDAFEREKQFTSDASHELRTPVAVITSECEYMEACAKTPEEFREATGSIKRQADRMSRLISDLLTISRMDKNTIKTTLEETNISELANFVLDDAQEINGEAVELVRSIAPDAVISADRFLLTRAMVNLVSNAYQYIGDGNRIEVTLEEVDDKIVFAVSDNGIGIEKDHLDKIWERFYQEDSSRSDRNTMGLGLSMVKWIANAHGGNVFAESEKGCGSKIGFVISK